ncbi:MAG TPA: radical SAM family heme chaperone HemW [Anaerolineae bacterium]|nr:radical SAM family heme chaperone HemW [Anaerolineae bacterium]
MKPETTYSLYLHIPFCRKKCTYCDFNTYAGMDDSFAEYTAALCREIRLMGDHRRRPPVRTIFIGGGTPTVLAIPQLEQILQACFTAFDILPDAEITSEANPGTVDESYLRKLLSLGVNRLSFGAQSFNPAELQMLGRIHSAESIGQTIAAARRAGARNLNVDLIYGLPNQKLSDWRYTLERAIALGVEHISLYSLTLERGTALRAQVVRGELPPPDSDLAADMYELADALLAEAGFRQYEISNWAKPGFRCEHNLTYWRNQPYLGMGPGAHSFENHRRWWNVRSVPQYIETVAAQNAPHPHPALADFETIDRRLEMGETMMLGLRLTADGVSRADFSARFGVPPEAVFGAEIAKLKALGLLHTDSQRLKLTPAARLLGNLVFAEFLPTNDE